ncbi:MAG: outer membrane beta-barrel protein, partial [Acidobacteriota bacterium]
ESRTTTLMGNFLVTAPQAWWGDRVRPFGVAGLGVFNARIGADDDFVAVRNTHLGLTLGGGVMSMFEQHLGFRADLRYLRDLQRLDGESEFFSLGETHVDFWRGTVGVVFRF